MKRSARLLLFGILAVIASSFLFAQVEPDPTPTPVIIAPGGVAGLPEVIIPAPIVAILITSAAVATYVYKLVDGLKGWFPKLRDSPKALKALNIFGNISVLIAGCLALSHEHSLWTLLWCVALGMSGAIITEGLRQGKKESDLARAADSVPQFKAAVVADVPPPAPAKR